MIMNGSRRRTPGGVFLHLLRQLKDPRVDPKAVSFHVFQRVLFSFLQLELIGSTNIMKLSTLLSELINHRS